MQAEMIREVEQFLYREARLLDERRFHAWLALFTDDVRYWMPVRSTRQWADEALLLLTQLYYAQHDAAQTIQAAERLNRDYPDSPLRPRASFSAARAYFELKNEARGCELIRQALDGAGDDVEFRNQVSFYASRCSASTTSATVPPAPPSSGGTPTSGRLWTRPGWSPERTGLATPRSRN